VALKAKLPRHVSNVNMSVVIIEQQLCSQWNTINMWDTLVPLYGSYGRQHAMLCATLTAQSVHNHSGLLDSLGFVPIKKKAESAWSIKSFWVKFWVYQIFLQFLREAFFLSLFLLCWRHFSYEFHVRMINIFVKST